MRSTILLAFLVAIGSAACGSSDGSGDDGPIGGSLTVTGQVVDFQSGTAVSTAASVTTSGLLPAPQVTTQGADFTITGVPENSAFQVLASAPPSHRQTFSSTVVV